MVDCKEADAALVEQQTLKFRNEREQARAAAIKTDRETGSRLAGAVFNLYTRDAIYSADGVLLFDAGALLATAQSDSEGLAEFEVDLPIQGERYSSNTAHDAATNSGKYFVREIRAPLGYYVNETELDCVFESDGQTFKLLTVTCDDQPTECFLSKRDLTNEEELPGATLTIRDADGNLVEEWISAATPHRITGLHLGEPYTLTETRPADGYALADSMVFRLVQKSDEAGRPLEQADVYLLTTHNFLFWTWDDWTLLADATVVMKDDTIKVNISKKDITTGEELPGATLVIHDSEGQEVERWISTATPHYIEKLPAGDYTLTEISAPNGYHVAETIRFTIRPTGEIQTVTMKDKRIEPPPQQHPDTPDPPAPTPAPTPVPTPARTPTIPQTGDSFPVVLLVILLLASAAALFAVALYGRRNRLPKPIDKPKSK